MIICDTLSYASGNLYQIWKESIQNHHWGGQRDFVVGGHVIQASQSIINWTSLQKSEKWCFRAPVTDTDVLSNIMLTRYLDPTGSPVSLDQEIAWAQHHTRHEEIHSKSSFHTTNNIGYSMESAQLMGTAIDPSSLTFIELRLGDAKWRHRTWSTLAQVMACFLMALSIYLISQEMLKISFEN